MLARKPPAVLHAHQAMPVTACVQLPRLHARPQATRLADFRNNAKKQGYGIAIL
jgi:hypothetical protein